MAIFYSPNKLKEAKVIIKNEHPIKGAGFSYVDDDAELKELVFMVTKWHRDSVKKNCLILEDYQISAIANYIVNNKYQVDVQNLVTTLSERASDDDFFAVLSGWENKYYSKLIKDYIGDAAANRKYRLTWEKLGINTEKMVPWLVGDSENLSSQIVAQMGTVPSSIQYKTNLHNMGVIDDTVLFDECMSLYFLVCSKDALLAEREHTLASAYQSYEIENKIKFVIHFLGLLSFVELYDYKAVYDAISNSMLNNVTKAQFESELQKEGLLEKYKQWGILYRLDQSLDDPERSAFWRNYVLSGKLIDGKEVMAIVFDNFAITEFKGKAAGPCYFYNIDFYKQKIEGRMRWDSKNEFQHYEYSLYESYSDGLLSQAGNRGRFTHQGDWKPVFRRALKRCGIEPTPGLK